MKNSNNKYLTTRKIAVIGIMTALIIALNITNLGIIDLRFIGLPVGATILHIPVIIGAILEGPLVGAIIGLFFGISSILNAIYRPVPISFIFYNPIVSVLPRILIGITSYYTYMLIKLKNEPIKIGIAAAVGTATNTIGVLSMIYLFYAKDYLQSIGKLGENAAIVIGSIALTNGVPELIISIIICIPIILKNRHTKSQQKNQQPAIK